MKRLYIACLSLVVILVGCTFRVNGALPIERSDMAAHTIHDMATHKPADMAARITPSADLARPIVDLAPPLDMTPEVHYRDAVQGILDARGCSATTCHQAYAPLIIPSPRTDPQWQQNYDNVLVDVMRNCDGGGPACSLILTKPLAGSSVTHAGGVKPFLSTADADYQTLLVWIEEGARL